ncbi:DHA2 family efflux MFS transporter permease subunit [Patulibacter brassicae]|jgi:EmrB/QacA subfamily drug resistance transporter|uniref:DHA2 family efflux MFS transporter permease subunit n=1 Tax=Patulibacter brassicae TaxID=1705717 RepID=A0ABU4VNI7_9ACTN|nr:DHA2 family efflux MFS transporter permease subunit [Patulibacter brassicae]MDX8153417.1 DHA2 family efflux MFS transporter permease subunit [Patulibacter brassicae]
MSPDVSPPRRDWIALYVLCLGMLMIVLDGTIVNTALPVLKESLDFSDGNLTWVLNAYLIPFGGLLMLSGRLGDLLGQRRMFVGGMALFTVASLLCGLAESQEMLIGARFLQGVGGALGSSVILGMIITMFREPRVQGRAIGVYSFVASAGGSIGLLLGGVLTDILSWHWIFFVNLPIGIATVVLALRLVPNPDGLGLREHRVDVPGAVLLTGGLMVLAYGIIGAEEHGWGATQTLALIAVAIASLSSFVVRQARIPHPLMPLRLFRSRNVTGANIVLLGVLSGMFSVFFFGARYAGEVLGYSPIEIGLAFLPLTALIGFASTKLAQPLAERLSPRKVLIGGLATIAAGVLLFLRSPVDGTYVAHVLPSMVLLGLGAGVSFPQIMGLAMSGVEPQDSGIASGVVNTSMQVGGAIALSVLATFAADRTAARVADGAAPLEALNAGFHVAYIIAAAVVVAAIVAAITVLREEDAPALDHAPAGDRPRAGAPSAEAA